MYSETAYVEGILTGCKVYESALLCHIFCVANSIFVEWMVVFLLCDKGKWKQEKGNDTWSAFLR
jgi:hypothetical protein